MSKFCNVCGNKLDNDDVFCDKCGTKFCFDESKTTNKKKQWNKKKKITVWILIIILLIVCTLSVIMGIKVSKEKQNEIIISFIQNLQIDGDNSKTYKDLEYSKDDHEYVSNVWIVTKYTNVSAIFDEVDDENKFLELFPLSNDKSYVELYTSFEDYDEEDKTVVDCEWLYYFQVDIKSQKVVLIGAELNGEFIPIDRIEKERHIGLITES